MKKLLVTLAVAAKTLALAAGIMLYAGSATAEAEDCMPCIPPPTCWPGEECWDEES